MEQGIKCPNCGGDKFKPVNDSTLKCAYCGHTIIHNVPKPVQPPKESVPEPPIQFVEDDRRDKTTAILLALFLGWCGAHKFYLRQSGLGLLYLVFCWSYVPAIISFVEFIILLCMNQSDFDRKYNSTR